MKKLNAPESKFFLHFSNFFSFSEKCKILSKILETKVKNLY